MIVAVACANENYIPSAKFQVETAKKKGKVDKTIIYNINDIDIDFKKKNKMILESGTGRRKGCRKGANGLFGKGRGVVHHADGRFQHFGKNCLSIWRGLAFS